METKLYAFQAASYQTLEYKNTLLKSVENVNIIMPLIHQNARPLFTFIRLQATLAMSKMVAMFMYCSNEPKQSMLSVYVTGPS